MVVLKLKVDVPPSRQLVIDLPADTPTGPADVLVHLSRPEDFVEIVVPEIDVSRLPHYKDPDSGEWRPVGRSGLVREVR